MKSITFKNILLQNQFQLYCCSANKNKSWQDHSCVDWNSQALLVILSQSHQIDPLRTFTDCVVKSFILYSILAENEENLVQLLSSTCGNFHVSLAWTLLILLLLLERMFDFTKPSLSQVVMSTLDIDCWLLWLLWGTTMWKGWGCSSENLI